MKMDVVAVAAPGAEEPLAQEVHALGLSPQIQRGGVGFAASGPDLARASLRLGGALYLSVRLGRFGARGFDELVKKGRRLPWSDFVRPGQDVRFDVRARKSRLFHTGAVAERLRDAAHAVLGPPADDAPAVRIRVQLDRDLLSAWVDASDPPLRQRGYRVESTKAPLREDLAWVLLGDAGIAVGGTTPLWDPFCGSGTLPIEAAFRLGGRAPGLGRRFAFESFPCCEPAWVLEARRAAEAELRPVLASVRGSDRDAGAIASAVRNAERAGVDVDFAVGTLGERAAALPPGAGEVVVCNPPYGRRIAGGRELPRLYRALGEMVRRRECRLALVCPDRRLARHTGVPLISTRMVDHGGTKVFMFVSPPV
jgi:putative N6-adenine-specific DNA methylase